MAVPILEATKRWSFLAMTRWCLTLLAVLGLAACNGTAPPPPSSVNLETLAASLFAELDAGDWSAARLQLAGDPILVYAAGERGDTPLHWAVNYGHLEAAAFLIRLGADPLTRNDPEPHQPYGMTSLTLAGEGHQKQMVAILCQALPPGTPNPLGLSELHLAVIRGGAATVTQLLAEARDLNQPDGTLARPLHWAAFLGRTEITKKLIARKADLAARDDYGATPLLWAAEAGQDKTAQLLLAAGAKATAAETVFGRTALHLAALSGSGPLVQRLLDRGAVIEQTDRLGNTALHWAAAAGQLEAVRQLCDRGAALAPSNREGSSPLALAEARGNKAVADLLRQRIKKRSEASAP